MLSSDLHRTFLESGLKPLAAFQKGFVKIWEMFQPIGRKGSKFKRTPSFQKSFKHSIASGNNRIRICKFNIIIEGEMKQ